MSAQIHRHDRNTRAMKIVRHAAESSCMLSDAMNQTDHVLRIITRKVIALHDAISLFKIKKLIHFYTSKNWKIHLKLKILHFNTKIRHLLLFFFTLASFCVMLYLHLRKGLMSQNKGGKNHGTHGTSGTKQSMFPLRKAVSYYGIPRRICL